MVEPFVVRNMADASEIAFGRVFMASEEAWAVFGELIGHPGESGGSESLSGLWSAVEHEGSPFSSREKTRLPIQPVSQPINTLRPRRWPKVRFLRSSSCRRGVGPVMENTTRSPGLSSIPASGGRARGRGVLANSSGRWMGSRSRTLHLMLLRSLSARPVDTQWSLATPMTIASRA